MADLESRVADIERWKNAVSTELAVRKEKDTHIDERFDRVEKRLDTINGGLSRVLWILGGSALTAAAAFVLKGGLNV